MGLMGQRGVHHMKIIKSYACNECSNPSFYISSQWVKGTWGKTKKTVVVCTACREIYDVGVVSTHMLNEY